MLNVLYHKENGVIINNMQFSIQEFQSIGKDEANLLKNDYLVVFFSEKLSFTKDINCNQNGINDDLLKIIKKIASKEESIYIQKRNEFDNPEISVEIQLQNKKNDLILIRKNYLNSTDYKIIKAVESGLEINIELNNQRQKARDEINEIENATSLEQLSQFE